MKVVLVSHTPSIGGAELVLLETVRGLVERGVQVDVIVPGRGRLREWLELVGARTWDVRFDRWAVPARPWAALGRRTGRNLVAAHSILQLLSQLRPDVVVTNTLTIPAAAVAAKILRIPHVWYVHEFGSRDHGFRFDLGLKNTLRLIGWLSARVIVNSHAVFEMFAKHVPVKKLQVVYSAVEVSERARTAVPEASGPFRLVLVGNIRPSKGQEDAVRALGYLRNRGHDVTLTLVGHGARQYVQHLRRLATELRVSDSVAFVDFTDDWHRYVLRSHVALMCSRAEAFGRVTVEAMKLGLPVIGANTAGTLELVHDGWNGLLYPPGDSVELAERIRRLSSDAELRTRLGRNGNQWARRRFSRARHTDDVLGVLASVVPKPAKWLGVAQRSTVSRG